MCVQTAENFGLIDRAYPEDEGRGDEKLTQWERFYRHVDGLNRKSPRNTDYKVLFLGRHGEGWHNVAESYYGTPAWNVSFRPSTDYLSCPQSCLPTDPTLDGSVVSATGPCWMETAQ
jgi:hypothetical protein